jgi:acetyl-CoA C-acetyltransferase
VHLAKEAKGAARVETYTIMHDREGAPEQGIVVARLEDSDARFLANTPPDRALLESLEAGELIGTRGSARSESGRITFHPG